MKHKSLLIVTGFCLGVAGIACGALYKAKKDKQYGKVRHIMDAFDLAYEKACQNGYDGISMFEIFSDCKNKVLEV